MTFIDKLKQSLRWPFYVGAAFILVAIALEHGFDVFGSVPSLGDSLIYTKKTIILLIAEIGYAFIIAWIVSVAIEAIATAERNKEVTDQREMIANDVMQAVFGIRHEKSYVRSVIETCFEQPHFREDYDLHYRVECFPESDRDRLNLEEGRFVLMHTHMRYRVRNMSGKDESFRIGYGLPTRSHVLHDLCKVTAISVGGVAFKGSEVAQTEITHNGENVPLNDRAYEFFVPVVGGGSVEILIKSQTVKEMSDNDTFGFRYPTSNARLRMDVNVEGLIFGVTPRVAANILEIVPPTDWTGEWKIDGPILPFNSVVFWWRTPKDDGQLIPEMPESVKQIDTLKRLSKRPRLSRPKET
jgi:hypothetical protein